MFVLFFVKRIGVKLKEMFIMFIGFIGFNKKRFIGFDCEGPIRSDDGAALACSKLVPKGDRVYSVLSRGVWLILAKYKEWWNHRLQAGTTLALLTFLLAVFGAKEEDLTEIAKKESEKSFVPGIKYLFYDLQSQNHRPFIFTTSYEWQAKVIAEELNLFPEELFCTKVPHKLSYLRAQLTDTEVRIAKMFIDRASEIYCDELSSGIHDEKILSLMDWFLNELSGTQIQQWLQDIEIMGSLGKPEAFREAVIASQGEFNNAIFIGDSSTDMGVAKLISEHRAQGKNVVFIAWNGTKELIASGHVTWGVAADNSEALRLLIDAWIKGGIKGGNAFIKEQQNHPSFHYSILERTSVEEVEEILTHHLDARNHLRGLYTANLI